MKDQIAIIWNIDDVKGRAPDLTDDECRQVLELVERKHDANIGVNWDVLDYWIAEVRTF